MLLVSTVRVDPVVWKSTEQVAHVGEPSFVEFMRVIYKFLECHRNWLEDFESIGHGTYNMPVCPSIIFLESMYIVMSTLRSLEAKVIETFFLQIRFAHVMLSYDNSNAGHMTHVTPVHYAILFSI